MLGAIDPGRLVVAHAAEQKELVPYNLLALCICVLRLKLPMVMSKKRDQVIEVCCAS